MNTEWNIESPNDSFGAVSDSFLYEMIENEVPFRFDIHIADYTELAGKYINTRYQDKSVLPNGMDDIEFEQYMTASETIYPVQITNFECMQESK